MGNGVVEDGIGGRLGCSVCSLLAWFIALWLGRNSLEENGLVVETFGHWNVETLEF